MLSSRKYAPDALARVTVAAFEAVGVPAPDAALVADALITADRRGIYSHGLIRLPLYIAALEAGGMNAVPEMTWRPGSGATGILDADSAMGQVAMREAVTRTIELARRFGVAVVAVEHSTHYGAGNYWSDLLTAEGLVALVTSTTGPVVAPFGGSSPILGTNPLTLAFPSSGGHALTADMATSAGAYGKVLAAKNAGTSLPQGWAVGPDGTETTDPTRAMSGALLPFGGHKGSGVSVLIEALSASFTDAHYAFETIDIWSTPSHRMNTGHFVLAINPDHFSGGAHTADRIRTLQDHVRSSGPGHPQAPGDPEMSRWLMSGERVDLAETTAADLDDLFTRLGIAPPEQL